MQQVVIENSVLNLPFEEPKRHFKFTEDGITDQIVEERRAGQYFVPIPHAKKKSPKQLSFEIEWAVDPVEENKDINRIREHVAIWRKGEYVAITKTTSKLLEYWVREDREQKLFFCQIEARIIPMTNSNAPRGQRSMSPLGARCTRYSTIPSLQEAEVRKDRSQGN